MFDTYDVCVLSKCLA